MHLNVVDGGETCFSCAAPCCTSYVVPLLGFDLWRLVRGLQLPWSQVAEVGADREGFAVDGGDERWGLFLRSREGEICRFLLTLPSGQQRCGAHSSRPLACRVYPWKPSDNNQLGIELTRGALCPPPQRAFFEGQRQAARAPVHEELAERPIYVHLLARWNQEVRQSSPEQFVAWMLALYDQLLELRQSAHWPRPALELISAFPLV